MLYKRTEGTLRTTHEIGSFLNKITAIKKDYIKDMRNLIASYAHKKMLVNENLDYTVKSAVETLISSIEDIIQFETTFTANLSELSVEIESFVKEKTAVRQKLKTEGETMTKELQNQHEALRRSKATYASMARDAEKQQAALVKASSDASVKTNKLAQMSTKTSIAIDKARSAESDYKDVVRATNERQSSVYTREMPTLLQSFQTFEEERVSFVNGKLCKYAECVLAWPKAYEDAGNRCLEAAKGVSAQRDIESYVQDNRTNKTVPNDIPVEIIPGPHNNNSTGDQQQMTSSTSGGAGNNGSGDDGGLGMMSACEDLLKERLGADSDSVSTLEMAVQRIDSAVKTDEAAVASLEKMAAAYGNSPARKKADAERDRIAKNVGEAKRKREEIMAKLEALRAKKDDVSNGDVAGTKVVVDGGVGVVAGGAGDEGSAGGSGGGSGNGAGGAAGGGDEGDGDGSESSGSNPEVMVRVRGVYDYEATCETELSFREGQEFIVTEQDSSGWWYATVDGKQGFVPANYVKVVE